LSKGSAISPFVRPAGRAHRRADILDGRHIALLYPLAQFAALRSRLVAAGTELIAPQRDTPFARFFFRDPNGYVFEVIDADWKP
jgi:catechol 2,3-dioxygenase-like lactoylglutathione lyase family enzyme